jgi:hypothetical protein
VPKITKLCDGFKFFGAKISAQKNVDEIDNRSYITDKTQFGTIFDPLGPCGALIVKLYITKALFTVVK